MTLSVTKKQRGLSLIELMIAIVLGLFITAGMIKLFINSKQAYRVQENLSRVQENGRFAMEFLARDIRMAGYWGCLGGTTTIQNNLNPAAASILNEIVATDNDGLNNSDSISITRADLASVAVVKTPSSKSANLKVTAGSGLEQNDIVIVLDCTSGDLFQITNDPTKSTKDGKDEFVHNSGSVSDGPGNANSNFQKKYSTDAKIHKIRNIEYYISLNPGEQPALYRRLNGNLGQELVEGIENMQILYGIDTDDNNTANSYVPFSAGLDLNNAMSIRISILATTLEDNLAIESSSTTLDTYTSPNDRKIRRIFTSTIALRNRLP